MTRFVSFTGPSGKSFGLWAEDGIIDLGAAQNSYPSMLSVLQAGALDEMAALGQGRAADYAHGAVVLDLPVVGGDKILCVGVNFPDRNAEYKDGSSQPKYMSLFPRFASSFTGGDQPLIRPPESEQLDYEGEIVVVIGKKGRRIAVENAYDHIAALSLCNEGTLRDWVRHAKFNVTQGKNFDRSGSIGPWMVPFRDPEQLRDIRLQTRVNGQVRQEDRTANMMFKFHDIIAYISTFATLEVGDMIVCGTPTGAGARFDPPIWLRPGDVVEVEADGIGILRNEISDEVL